MRRHPTRLTVEVTTRCNLRCAMCVKQAPGCEIEDGDMARETFALLAPAFAHLDSLVLTGIGEPLMHPRLEAFAALARAGMPAAGRIGLQSNGCLLDARRAASLAGAGVDRVCLSVDGATPEEFRARRAGGELADVERAFAALAATPIEAGAETVLTRGSVDGLPELVRWVAARGGRFLLVSHLLPYAPQQTADVAYPSNSDAALAIYHRWKDRARSEGLDLDRALDVLWRFAKSPGERRVTEMLRDMLEEARQAGMWMRPQRLLGGDESFLERVERAFGAARERAAREGLDLVLPAAMPRAERRCDFLEEGRAFVDRLGRVAPCHFLWHRYVCHLDGRRKPVSPLYLGTLGREGLEAAWNSPRARAFRDQARRYDHPYCLDCAMSPCDLVEAEVFDVDCHGGETPCGDCPWALGLLHCLD